MYYGKVTDELKKLYYEYYDMFGDTPDCYEELEYGDVDYDDYVADIKKALKEHKELPDVLGLYGEEFEKGDILY